MLVSELNDGHLRCDIFHFLGRKTGSAAKVKESFFGKSRSSHANLKFGVNIGHDIGVNIGPGPINFLTFHGKVDWSWTNICRVFYRYFTKKKIETHVFY